MVNLLLELCRNKSLLSLASAPAGRNKTYMRHKTRHAHAKCEQFSNVSKKLLSLARAPEDRILAVCTVVC